MSDDERGMMVGSLECWRGSGIGGLGIVDEVVSSLCKVEGSSICGREIVILGTIVYVTPTVMINGTDRFWLRHL